MKAKEEGKTIGTRKPLLHGQFAGGFVAGIVVDTAASVLGQGLKAEPASASLPIIVKITDPDKDDQEAGILKTFLDDDGFTSAVIEAELEGLQPGLVLQATILITINDVGDFEASTAFLTVQAPEE